VPFDPSSGAVNLILGLAAAATLFSVVRTWTAFWDEDFTAADRRLATQAAVFLIPPVVVLFHELGHYFTARAVGAQVTSFRYGLFQGSVGVRAIRDVEDLWLIALNGNLVSALSGIVLVVVAAGTALKRPLRYTLYVGGVIELVFSLIGYPVLSLFGRFGDWIAIYDFDRTPGLSGATAAVHGGMLLVLWQWWRRRGRAELFAIGTGGEAQVAALRAAIGAAPRSPAPWLQLADYYARRGELGLARGTVEEGIGVCGETSRLLLGLTRLSMFQGRWNDAMVAARRGLQVDHADGPDEVRQALWANLALALTQMERPDHALPAYERLTAPLVDDVRVRYGRGLTLMASGEGDRGRADLRAVVASLPEENLLRKWAEARLDGHPLREWGDPSAPAYQRGGPPPPAPLAGL